MVNTIPVEQFGALIEASVAVTTQPDLRGVLEATVRVVRDATAARYVALGVVGVFDTLTEFVHSGVDVQTSERIGDLPVGKGVLGTMIRNPEPLRLDRLADHPDAAGFPPGHPTMMSFLGVPVRVGDALFGNLYLADKDGGFSQQDEVLVVALAAIAGGAVAAVRLHQRLAHMAVVEERERIARDIHDAVIQDLIAVGLNVQAFAASTSNEATRHALDEIVDRIEDGVNGLRSSILGLRISHDPDPRRALNDVIVGVRGSVDVDVVVADGILDELTPLEFDHVCNIVREAISNANRHASASRIGVTIRRTGTWMEVTVDDDGVGFDPDIATDGLGLHTMRERAGEIGGEVEVSSAPGAGTRVRASVPV